MRVTIEFSIILVDYQWLLSFDEKMKEAKSLDGNVGNGSEKMKEAESFQ